MNPEKIKSLVFALAWSAVLIICIISAFREIERQNRKPETMPTLPAHESTID